MSDKKEAGLSEIDMQAVIAAFVLANGGRCDDDVLVSCDGAGGRFPGTPRPLEGVQFDLFEPCALGSVGQRAVAAKEWLDKYHQQKAEAAKKQEQEAKQGPARICGNCKHIHEVEKSENMTAQCDMKDIKVPILFDRCPDFEPRTEEASLAAAITSTEQYIPADKKARAANDSSSDMLESWVLLTPDIFPVLLNRAASVISRLKKKNAQEKADYVELSKIHATVSANNLSLADKYCGYRKKIASLEKENAKLREKLDVATKKKNPMDSSLVEQLKQMGQRIKDLEREASERSWPPRSRFFL